MTLIIQILSLVIEFARVGLIENPLDNDSNITLLTTDKASAVYALRLDQ